MGCLGIKIASKFIYIDFFLPLVFTGVCFGGLDCDK